MGKKVIIAGATGMIGGLILKKCLASEEISKVIIFIRKTTGIQHKKLTEVIISDFKDFSGKEYLFKETDIAFFCIGVYTGQVSDEKFAEITIEYPTAFAEVLKKQNNDITFCFLSGAGADRSQKSRISFARYKGIAENQLSQLGFKAFYAFRPSYIYPVHPRKEPNIFYKIYRTLYPVIKMLGKNYSIKSTELAQVMFYVSIHGASKEVLENKDIIGLLKE